MKHPELAITGLVLAVALGGTAGCSSDERAAGPQASAATTPAADADPAAVLAGAAAKVDQQSYRLTVGSGGGDAGDGTTLVWDPAQRRGLETTSLAVANGKVTIERLVTGPEVYVKITAPDRRVPSWDGRTWWHVGAAATARKTGLDTTRIASTLGASTGVRRTADREYAGTLDLRGSAAVLGDGIGGILGDRAAAVPFTAAVDERGRLVRYRIELAAQQGQASALDLTYADFGLPVRAEQPAADVIGENPPSNIPGA
ncbi:hypothetical protein V6U81_18795 [Micromonospora sp. CPCC 205711]|uniref:hypothetical protein n=1 Tax=Micromonospora sp. CPCC 205547 TaxID=3122400 RepID=UPI002FF07E12